VYGDEALIKMFNSGDVYSAMAQHFYASELTEAERQMSGKEFKEAREDMRDRMKICTLGIIYGMTPFGVSRLLYVSESEARKLMYRFMAMFPTLKLALFSRATFGAIAGHVATVTGLRRYRARPGQLSNWERNWMTNHPVQGSAADVFKDAGNRLDRLYPALGARLIIPFHDAIVFEAPLENLVEVAELTRQELCRAVQQRFPQLRPRADINIERPDCWNKRKIADLWKQWLADPLSFLPRSSRQKQGN
jgi:DNA polymerase-1